jgi:hypothetical protein
MKTSSFLLRAAFSTLVAEYALILWNKGAFSRLHLPFHGFAGNLEHRPQLMQRLMSNICLPQLLELAFDERILAVAVFEQVKALLIMVEIVDFFVIAYTIYGRPRNLMLRNANAIGEGQ